MPSVFITRPVAEPALALLRKVKLRVDVFEKGAPSRSELISRAKDSDAVICTLADTIDAPLLEKLPRLKILANHAVGTNNIDLSFAKARGIVVANTPGVLTDATAELAVGLMLAACRRMVEGDVLTRQGKFTGWAPLFHLGRGLCGKTVGIVGAGRIGQRVGEMLARGFGCKILYFSRSRQAEFERAAGAILLPLDELLRDSDFVSLHVPLTKDTHHLIDARKLALMKPSAYLINTARGPVVDEKALLAALKKRAIAGAGLDVYENEPQLTKGLTKLSNVVLLPHIGSATIETREKMGVMCAQAVIAALKGEEPANRVV